MISCLWLACGLLACRDSDPALELPAPGPPPGEELTQSEIDSSVTEATRLIEERDFDAAIERLRPAASRLHVDPRVSFLYGKALLLNRQPSLALWPLSRLAETAEPDSEVAYLHARALLGGGDADSAVRELDRLIDLVPDDTRLIGLRSKAHHQRLDYEKALIDLDRLIELQPEELGVYEGRIDVLKKLDRIGEAREAVASLAKRIDEGDYPAAVKARYCSASAVFEQQQAEYDRAREIFQGCLALYPVEPDVVLAWIQFLDEVGESDAATQAIEAATQGAGATRLRLKLALARRYAAQDRREETARVLYETAERMNITQPLFALADHRVAWGDLAGAREVVNEAIERQYGASPLSPDFSWNRIPEEGRFAFGDLLIRTGQFAEVEALIDSFESEASEDLSVYAILLRARLHLVRGEPAEALSLFEDSFRYWPGNVGSRYLAGRAAMELGEFDRAMSFYQDAFRADPAASDAGFVLAQLQNAQGLQSAAANSLSTYLGQLIENPRALRLLANLASTIGAEETATLAREDLASRPAWTGQAWADQAVSIAAKDGIEAAIANLESHPELEKPANYEALSQWFLFHKELGQLDPAIERIRQLRASEEPAAGREIVWARVLGLTSSREAAIEAYRDAIELDATLVAAHSELGLFLLEAEEFEAAEAAFARALALDRSHLEARMGLANTALAAGRIEDAEQRYRDVLIESPWYGPAARSVARIRLDRGDTSEEALTLARWAARFNGSAGPESAVLLGEMRFARAEWKEALMAFQVAMQINQGLPPRILYLMGRASHEMGDDKQAVEALTTSLSEGEFAEARAARELLASLQRGDER